MLWYKSWLETRWRFLIGLALLLCSACGVVMLYPQMLRLLPLAPPDLGGEVGRQIREQIELSSTYRGYVWTQWFRQNLPQTWTLIAILLGTGGLLSRSARGGTLYTLSLPVARHRLVAIRVAIGLAELLALAIVPTLLIPLLSPSIGQSYALGDALVHAGILFVAGSVFFSLALFLSTEFDDFWRPLLIVLGVAIVIGTFEQFSRGIPFGLFRTMSAESWFRDGHLPWLGLFATAAVSTAMLYAAARNIARREF